MSALRVLLEEASAAGVTLWLEGEAVRLRCESGELPDGLLERLKANKEGIRSLLEGGKAASKREYTSAGYAPSHRSTDRDKTDRTDRTTPVEAPSEERPPAGSTTSATPDLDPSTDAGLVVRDRRRRGALEGDIALRLYSRALDRELWLALDASAAWDLWREEQLPVLTLAEHREHLAELPAEDLDPILNYRAAFGPAVAIRRVRTGGCNDA